MRLTLSDYGENRDRLVWTVHHIHVDGRAFILVVNNVEGFHQRLRDGEPVSTQLGPTFRPHIAWLQSLDLDVADKFWVDRLHGLARPTPLLEDAQAPGGTFSGSLPEGTRTVNRYPTRNTRARLTFILAGDWPQLRWSPLIRKMPATELQTHHSHIQGIQQ
jgi:hypothetical protein